MNVYADTSFFVSLYVEDRYSPAAQNLMNPSVRVWLTPLHYAEWTHSVAQQVFHRRISASEAQNIYRHLESDRIAGVWIENPLPERLFDLCADLARRHGPRLGVRTLDSLHVALALQLKAEGFWTFDERQAKLAKAEGLKISLT